MTAYTPYKTIDVRGKFCPTPVLETAKAMKDVPPGEILEILATDPAAKPDLEAWAKRTGNEFLGAESTGECVRIYIRRGRP